MKQRIASMSVYRDKQRNTWFVVTRYKDWTGKAKQTTKRGFRTKHDAQRYESLFIDKKKDSTDILFKNFVEIYLESMEHRIKENTLMTKQNIFYHHIVPYLGEMKFWTKEEYLTFSRAMMNKEESYHAFEILYWCGIRLGELLALTAEDFDFEKKTLRINKSYQRIKGKDVITTPKTRKSNRVLTLPDFLAEEMQDYISRLPYLKVDDRIFTITKSGLHHEIDRGCRETGVKRIRVHDLRHSHVSMLIEMGFSAVDIANRVGHESVKVTYRYAHMFPNKDLMIAKKLNISRNGEKDEQEEPGSERTFEK